MTSVVRKTVLHEENLQSVVAQAKDISKTIRVNSRPIEQPSRVNAKDRRLKQKNIIKLKQAVTSRVPIKKTTPKQELLIKKNEATLAATKPSREMGQESNLTNVLAPDKLKTSHVHETAKQQLSYELPVSRIETTIRYLDNGKDTVPQLTTTTPRRPHHEYEVSNEVQEQPDLYAAVRDVTEAEYGYEANGTTPKIITELLATTENIIDPDSEGEKLDIGVELGSERVDETFALRLVEYVQSFPEAPEKPVEDQPIVILENIVKVAAKIQKLQEQQNTSEVLQNVEEELLELCAKLLESLGAKADEKVVARLVEKMLGSDYSNIKIAQLSPQELATLGTHEYKLEDWFHKFKQLLDNTIHPHQTMGRLALSLSAVF